MSQSSTPLISVIVPVYNVEKYLERCLNSICNQSLRAIEIICVNDASPDKSFQILHHFADKDNRIRIINLEKNGGLSNARNKGMKAARGEYIGFVDSDDFIDLDFYEKLYNAAKMNDADISFTEYKQTHGADYFIKQNIPGIYCGKLEKFQTLSNGPVWNKIFRREMIERNKAEFIQGISLEDNLFSFQTFYYANKIVTISGTYYNYIINPVSIMNNPNNVATRERDSFVIAKEMLSFLQSNQVSSEIVSWAHNFIITNVVQRKTLANWKTYTAWKKLLNNHPRLNKYRYQSLRNWIFSCSSRKRYIVLLGHYFTW